MNYLKITPNYVIPERLVRSIANYKGKEMIKRVKRLKAEGKAEDITYGKKINTVILLVDGGALLTNVGMDTILNRLKSLDTQDNV